MILSRLGTKNAARHELADAPLTRFPNMHVRPAASPRPAEVASPRPQATKTEIRFVTASNEADDDVPIRILRRALPGRFAEIDAKL